MAACSIELSENPLGLSLHPSRNTLLAAGLVDGTVELHDFAAILKQEKAPGSEMDATATEESDEEDTILSSTLVHNPLGEGTEQCSCRVVKFLSNGTSLLTGGARGDLVCLDATRTTVSQDDAPVQWRIPDATFQKKPLQVIHEISPNSFATGDEGGCVRLWDIRLVDTPLSSDASGDVRRLPRGCVQAWKKHDDYISALEHLDSKLLATSADARLSVYDIRMSYPDASDTGFVRMSDDVEDELLSMQIIKNGRKVVCGTGEGVLAIFSVGTWGDVSDRFPGHTPSIDALAKIDEDTLVMGTSDGKLKIVTIQPDREIGVIGGSNSHNEFPIERVELTTDGHHVATMTHDNIVRLFDISVLDEAAEDEGGDGKVEDGDSDDWSNEGEDDERDHAGYHAKRLKTDNENFFGDLA